MTQETADHRPVVVGVSLRTGSPDALAWAADEAARRHAPLLAVAAWWPDRPVTAGGARPPAVEPRDPGDQQYAAEDALRAAVRDALGPDADPRRTAVRGRPATVLLDAAVEAQLLVLGAPRTLGATRRGLLVTTLAHRAHCPVVAMPVGEARRSRLSRITDSARGRP